MHYGLYYHQLFSPYIGNMPNIKYRKQFQVPELWQIIESYPMVRKKEKRTADTAPDAPIDTNDGSLRRFIKS